MSKDTIYIDVDDDITAIIGKVKGAKSNIVALVPPKRTGVLQSAVNLRLLARAAKQGNKHLVLISGNSALTALAASAGIPAARNLQSKPELALVPVAADDSGDDVIDGADLPIGDLARTDETSESMLPVAAPAIDSAIRANAAEEDVAGVTPPVGRQAVVKKRTTRVPNFDTFRKKMVVGVAALLLLGGFLVWAIMFAPSAKIVITARTIDTSANPKVVLATNATTDANAGTLKATRQEIKKEASLAFDATGEKEVGEKSKGQVVFQNCESDGAVSVPAGTGISASGKTYITQTAVTVPGAKGFATCIQAGQSTPVDVVAQAIGEEYDADQGTRFSVAGHPNSSSAFYFRATSTSDIDGGSKKKVTVVTEEDIDKAADQLANQSRDDMKKQLVEKFGAGVIIIDDSFTVNKNEIASVPAVDQEAVDGKSRLTGSVTYTMIGVTRSEAGKFLDALFAKQIKDTANQRVYNNGAEKTTFVDVTAEENGYKATMTATATLGPKIDDGAVKKQAGGKKFGEVQSAIEGVSGVENVDVKFSPFWVRTVPEDEDRITIEFNLDESK